MKNVKPLFFLIYAVLMLPIVLLPHQADADVNGDLGNFFSSLGYQGNVSRGNAYQGQQAGYYSGGSLFLRNQVRNIQIMHVDLPSYRSGCGGIDLFNGGFSFINDQAFTNFLRQIMDSAGGYAFNLALETVTPEIAHSMQYIQSIAEKVNSMNINSCEMGEDLVGGLWPKTRASQQQVCQDIGTQSGAFADWAAARQGCTTNGQFDQEIEEAAQNPQYKDRVVVNKNLIWDALQKNGFLNNDTELAEFFMSLSGTMVYDEKGEYRVYYPLTSNLSLLNALMYGGSAQIYACDEPTRCLNPSVQSITISQQNGLVEQVNQMINSMVASVQADSGLTDEQKGFLNATNIPVLKFITVSLSLNHGASALDLTNYSELIAKNLLEQYLMESLQTVEQSVTATDSGDKKALLAQIEQAERSVENLQIHTHEDLQDGMALINSTQYLEREVSGDLTNSFQPDLTR